MRIKYIVPFPLDAEGVAIRASQIPASILSADTVVECVPVRNSGTFIDSHYEALLMEMYIVEAGIKAEDEGFDAVIMDTFSDSGINALRSRLTIPVMGPGIVAYCVGMMLGQRFSILLTWDRWRFIDERNLMAYQFGEKCVSVRTLGEYHPDVKHLLKDQQEDIFPQLLAEAKTAIEADGADVILLGSTTMHHAGEYLQEHLDVPVVNPGPVAIKITESLVQLGLTHSKAAYPTPMNLHDEKWFSLIGANSS